MDRVHNFSAGPAALPLPVLEEAQRDLVCYPGAGASVMEISHRSKAFAEIHERAKNNIKTLFGLGDTHHVLFLQGGASFQFSMLAANFLRGSGKTAEYVLSGAWADKAVKEAKKEGETRVIWSDKDNNFRRMPGQKELKIGADAAYLHITSNETIQGIEFQYDPDTGGVPLICDASSNMMSRPVDLAKYALYYGGAQKNVGPSGVAVAILRNDMLERVPQGLHSLMDYKLMAQNDSLYNTPPAFGVYMIMLTTKWMIETIGGLDKMLARNRKKAQRLYDAIDASAGFYKGHASVESRSLMNVTWTLANAELEGAFLQQAKANRLHELKGHRSVGGIRASIYNACEPETVEALADFMDDFRARNGG